MRVHPSEQFFDEIVKPLLPHSPLHLLKKHRSKLIDIHLLIKLHHRSVIVGLDGSRKDRRIDVISGLELQFQEQFLESLEHLHLSTHTLPLPSLLRLLPFRFHDYLILR